MNTTKAAAIEMLTKALKACKIVTVKRYTGSGVVTAGPCNHGTGPKTLFAAYFYPVRADSPDLESYVPVDVARHVVEHCGRGNVRKAVEKAMAA